jgi:type II secretory pathway component PulM
MASTMDKVREKWESITPRERNLVMLLGAAAVVVLLAWLGLSIRDGLARIEKRNAETEHALNVLLDYRAAGGGTKKASGPAVTIGDEPVSLRTYLDGIAADTGVTIPRYDKRNDVTKEPYVITSTKIALEDVPLAQLKDFLEKVESKNRLVVVTELHIKRDFRDKEKLDADMVISTYSKVKPAAGTGSGNGSGSAATGKGG